MFCAISTSHLSPLLSNFSLLYKSSWCVSVEYSKFGPSTIASTGHASWQKPQKMHLVISISYLVALREPSSRGSASIVMACHYDESLECAHVSINEVACYRTERTMVGCADPPSKGVGAPNQCSRVNEKRSGWGESSLACAGQTASQSLHAMHRSSPLGYRRSACSPRNLGESGAFSNG